MNRLLLIVILCLSAAGARAADPFSENVRSTDPLPPEEQLHTFRLPPGFEIQLVASEPDIQKPLNMAFDAKGRLWVSMSREYPFPAPLGKPGRDSIRILEDFDENGRARKITTFVDGLNIPTGLYPYKDGVIAWSIPNIWFFRDTDGNGRADKREVLYGPFGWERDTHGNQASFRRGFDGWLYATHGYNNISRVRGRDGSEVRMQSGNTYRMTLDGGHIEQHTHGQVNPFGLCFDPAGNIYSADCHSAPIYELLRGAYYPSFGKPHGGLGFGPTLMEHSHGSTAICGIIFYADDKWPAEFQNTILIGNVMTSRINRDTLETRGSTKRAIEQPDFLTTTDPWFRPVDLQLGPDGALYIADFYNRIIGHYEVPLTHPGRDRERARIWRVVYTGEPLDEMKDFTKLPARDLVKEFASANLTRRLLALNAAVDRGAEMAGPIRRALGNAGAPATVISLWALHRLGAIEEADLARASRHRDAEVRVHAMRILEETPEWPAELAGLARGGLKDEHALVQRAAASALGLHPAPENLRPLLDLRHEVPAEDAQLLHTVRMALRDQLKAGYYPEGGTAAAERDARALADVALGVHDARAAAFLFDYLQSGGMDEPRGRVADYVRHIARYGRGLSGLAGFIQREFEGDIRQQLAFFRAIQEGSKQRGAELTGEERQWGRKLAAVLLEREEGGHAWRNHPAPNRPVSANPWILQERNSADGQKALLISSLPPGGEQLTGILRSAAFEAPVRFSFWIAGHDGFPSNPPGGNNLARLVDVESGDVLAQAPAPRNDVAQLIEWQLDGAAGRRVAFEIVDADTGSAYAWVAAGRFDPPVVTVPPVDPRNSSERIQSGAELAKSLGARELAPRLRELLAEEGIDIEALAAVADAVVFLSPNEHRAALAALVGDGSINENLRDRIRTALARGDSAESRELVREAMRLAPSRAQLKLAQSLAGSQAGAGSLVKMIEQGGASARLLLDPTVKNKISAIADARLQKRVKGLTEYLPPLDGEIQQLIQRLAGSYEPAKAEAVDGAQVFTKNCAVCHQIDGSGSLIGPQLDGIGTRGLERVIEDIVDPNRNVDINFRTEILVLKDSDVLTGLPRREEGDVLVLADAAGKETSVRKDEIEMRRTSDTSLMPSNFADVLTPQEFNDLLAFLLSRGGLRALEK